MKIYQIYFSKNYWLIGAFLLFFVTINAQNEKYPIASIPVSLLEDANSLVRYNYMKFSATSPKSANLEVKMVVTIFNAQSNWAELYVFYDKREKIKKLKASILDANGKVVRKFSKGDFEDMSAVGGSLYTDSRMKVADFSYGVYPYTVVYEYEKSFSGLLTYPESTVQHFNAGVELFEFIVEMPKEMPLRYRTLNFEQEPEISTKDNKQIYHWKISNLPAIKREAFMPYANEVLPMVDIEPAVFEYDGYKGDMSSWGSFGQFLYELNDGRDALTPELKNTIKTLTAGLESNAEKIKVLYRYLQENMRYVSVQLGIGGWQTFDAAYVEKNKFGDCKALSSFMKAMLKEAGITAHTATIYGSRNNRILHDGDFSSPLANHMILYVPEDDMWLECTSSQNPPGYFGSSNADRSALLITKNGGELVRTPAFSQQDNCVTTNATIKLAADGSAKILNNSKFLGPEHEYYRYLKYNVDQKEQQDEIFEDTSLPAFNLESFELDVDSDKPEASLSYEMNVRRYASGAGKRIFVPLNLLNPYDNVLDPTEKRIHPVQVHQASTEKDEYTFELPEGYKIESIPSESVQIVTEFGKYSLEIKTAAGKLFYNRLLEVNAIKTAANRFDDFRDFYKEVATADNMKLVLVKK